MACNINRTVAQITDRKKAWTRARERRFEVQCSFYCDEALWSDENWFYGLDLTGSKKLCYHFDGCHISLRYSLPLSLCLCVERVNWMTKLTTGKILRILKINDAIIGLAQIIRLPCQIISREVIVNQTNGRKTFFFLFSQRPYSHNATEVKRGFTFNLFLFYSFIVDIRRLQTINWKSKRKKKIKKSIRTQLKPSINKKIFPPREERNLSIFLFIFKREKGNQRKSRKNKNGK